MNKTKITKNKYKYQSLTNENDIIKQKEKWRINQRKSRLNKKLLKNNPHFIDDVVNDLKENGYYISKLNYELKVFLQGYSCGIFDPERKGFHNKSNLVGSQVQYKLKENEQEELIDKITPFIQTELEIIKKFFNKDSYKLTDIKLTTNTDRKGISNGCFEQCPHTDVDTDKFIFLIMPLYESIVATKVYRKKKELLKLKTEDEVKKFFTIPDKEIRMGQIIFLLPSFIHGAPKFAKIPRIQLYLEYTTIINTANEFNQVFADEMSNELHYVNAINSLINERNWEISNDKTKKKKEVTLGLDKDGKRIRLKY